MKIHHVKCAYRGWRRNGDHPHSDAIRKGQEYWWVQYRDIGKVAFSFEPQPWHIARGYFTPWWLELTHEVETADEMYLDRVHEIRQEVRDKIEEVRERALAVKGQPIGKKLEWRCDAMYMLTLALTSAIAGEGGRTPGEIAQYVRRHWPTFPLGRELR